MNESGRRGGRIVEVELGFDRFEATTIVEACRAEGLEVELLQMDRNGVAPGFVALAPHRLLAREIDLEMVTRIVDRSFPQSEHELHAEGDASVRRPGRIVVRLVAVAMLALILASVGQQIADHL